MSKLNALESLLTAFSKTEKLREDTEALKPKLEAEINSALEGGDPLNEKIAQALQTKRGQLDLIPAKLAQIATRLASLRAEIQEAFDARNIAFSRAVGAAGDVAKAKLRDAILPVLQESQVENGEVLVLNIFPRTKFAAQLAALESPIQFQLTVHQNAVEAARLLLLAEKELAGLKP